MDNLFEQFANISKAGAYDILVEQVKELKEENKILQSNLNVEKKYSSLQFDELNHVKELNRELIEALESSIAIINNLEGQYLEYVGTDSDLNHKVFTRIQVTLSKANSINQ